MFAVTVTAPPRISLTSYLAFGDSLTAGEIVSEGQRGLRALLIDPVRAYPTVLKNKLIARYTAQAGLFVVSNNGRSGELAVDGVGRLRGLVRAQSFEALLLMEGANDITSKDTVAMNRALTAMRAMVQAGKDARLRVFLATLPPEDPRGSRGGGALLLPQYNEQIRIIASQENVVLVDVFQAFGGDLSLIDFDGLHPTALGYERIAATFFSSIMQTLEVPAASAPARSPAPSRTWPSSLARPRTDP